MTKGIQIVSTGSALPKKILTNDDLSKIVDTNDEWISTRTGIKERRQCSEESTVSLAIEASRKAIMLMEEKGLNKSDIGAVIVATSTPDYVFPSVACMIQKELELSEEVAAFDLSAACTGFLYSLLVGAGMINTLDKKYILLVGSEQLSQIVDYTDRGTCILFGDGAGAAVIEASEVPYIQKSWTRGNLEALSCGGVGREDNFIHMKGNDVFKFAVKAMEQGIDEVLEKAGKTLADVDYVVCHQANLRIIDHVRKKFPEYEDKFFVNISHYGNTSAASIPIAIDEICKQERSTKGSGTLKLLCVGFGAGLAWSGALIECCL